MEYAGAAGGPLAQMGQEAMNIFNSKIPYKDRVVMSAFGIYPEYAPIFRDKESLYRAQGLSAQAAANKAARSVLKIQGLGVKGPSF